MLTEKRLTPLTFSIDIQGYSALEVSHACVYLRVCVCVCVCVRARARACVSVTRSMCHILYLLVSTKKNNCLPKTTGLDSRMV